MKRALNTFIFFALLIGVWAALTGDLLWLGVGPLEPLWSPYVLPPPSTVGQYLWDNTVNGKIPLSMLITLRRLLIGYAIGLVLGVPLGMLSASPLGLAENHSSWESGLPCVMSYSLSLVTPVIEKRFTYTLPFLPSL